MSDQGMMNGAEWLARALAGTGMSHVFFVESVLRRTLLHLGDLGVKPILAHSEKAAAYMADGYARVSLRPGVCMAQAVGAANLASGLQDPWLGRSPVIALTGHKPASFQHRNAYQEIPHAPLFAAVTKFSTPVDSTSELPRLLRHAWAPRWPTRRARPISISTGTRAIRSSLARPRNRRSSRPRRARSRCTGRSPMSGTSNARRQC
jgi:acetolactate synthase I/II/III large subunit